MRLPTPHIASSPVPGSPAPTSTKKRALYVLGGCGCVTLCIVLLLLVGLVALGSMADEVEKAAKTHQSRGTVLHNPGKARAERARTVAESYLDHLEKQQIDQAWDMAGSAFHTSASRDDFAKLAQTLTAVGARKERHFVDSEPDVIRDESGQKRGVQKMTFEYRNGHQRRALECWLGVQDAQILGGEGSGGDAHDFKILGTHCKRIYIALRKKWGDKPTGKYAKSLQELSRDGWPAYPRHADDTADATAYIRRFQQQMARGRYRQAAQLLTLATKDGTQPFQAKGARVMLEAAGKHAFRSAKVGTTGWQADSLFNIWLNDGVSTETYEVRLELPAHAGKQMTFVFGLERRWDLSRPKEPRPGRFLVSKMEVEKTNSR